MASNVGNDRFALIRIEGMHCHKCEQAIRKALSNHPSVREVEVDFASGQASILLAPGAVPIGQLMEAVNQAGYRAVSFVEGQKGRAKS
jgi:uncharacterized protein